MDAKKQNIRPSPIAGKWYPGSAKVLSKTIEGYLMKSRPCAVSGTIIGIIVPHAGYRYSGQVAAHAFRCLQGKSPEVVAIVSPFHPLHYDSILISDHTAYRTPLGEVPIDEKLVQAASDCLREEYNLDIGRVSLDQEHSLEIELPFLQTCLEKPFRLLPIMMREQSQAAARAVGQTLINVLGDRPAILVASSDLSHFHTDEAARELDSEILARAEAFDPDAVVAAEDEGLGFACGRGAMAAVMWAARGLGADKLEVIEYATSGDVTGDRHSVVGYAAAVLYKQA